MLILTRKQGESVAIGDDIQVTIVDIQGKQVKLGVRAPREIAVHRQEIFEKIQEENVRAAEISQEDLDELENALSSDEEEEERQ